MQTDAGGGLVHQVDGFIRQKTVGNISVGQADGGLQRFIGNLDLVVRLIAIPKPFQNSQRFLSSRFAYHDRLETAFQRRIFFDVLPIFVDGGSADALQLTAGQRGLEDVGRIHAAFCLACSDDGMEFIDKQDHVALFVDFLNGILQAFLKFAAIFASGDHTAQIQRKDPFACQGLRHFSGHDQLRQALDDGAFAHARFADQHRVIFGAAAHDLHDTLDLGRAPHHRIQFAILRRFSQVAAIFFKGIVAFASRFAILSRL